jgi:hypothetical protein
MFTKEAILTISDPTIAKARRKVLPPFPQSCIFTIPDQYKLTSGGERFLLIDESPVRRERLLIFASDRQLDLLFQSGTIYMDGTFSKTPPHFTQVYIIHAVNYDICKEMKRSPFGDFAFFS